MSDRFFTSEPLAPGEFLLTGPEAHHLASVRRFVPGDRVTLFNGDGREYSAEVVSTDRKRVLLNVLESQVVNRELPIELTIAAAMPKGDRGDFLIEKLVELGVSRFVPLVTERTIVQPKDSRLEKLNQAVIEASKQCGRNVLMRIDALTKWSDFAKGATGWRAVLHPDDGEPEPRRVGRTATAAEQTLREARAASPATSPVGLPRPSLRDWSRSGPPYDALHPGTGDEPGGSSVVAVGPEGGFTNEEVTLAESHGWIRVSLGPRILRVETAAIAAASHFALQ